MLRLIGNDFQQLVGVVLPVSFSGRFNCVQSDIRFGIIPVPLLADELTLLVPRALSLSGYRLGCFFGGLPLVGGRLGRFVRHGFPVEPVVVNGTQIGSLSSTPSSARSFFASNAGLARRYCIPLKNPR